MGRRIVFQYRSEVADAPAYREVIPYGLLFGYRAYLVAAFPWDQDPVNYRLDRMADLSVSETAGMRPPGFDLDAYSARSFGVFQEEPHDVVLLFAPEVTDEVASFRFHPTQIITREADGCATVRFRAGGLREMAWHLFTWGDAITIVAPEDLKAMMLDCLEASRRALSE
jgi:predicted DNA-binding transcriptional regulator YafY